jgi:protein-S-isoprenylcysteine O-methyltransferase Ste14
MIESLAIITIMFWALVPLFWIPVHSFSAFFKKIGIFTYITPLITWLPFVVLIYSGRQWILTYRFELPVVLQVIGWVVFILGLFLQLWTLRVLGGLRIIGFHEVSWLVESKVITSGPFSVIRHPTYASHTIMYAGVFLISGVIALGIITLLDIIIINAFVIPLEDRELAERLGDEYKAYRDRVPAFFPGMSRKS